MAKESDYAESDTGNWNSARAYSQEKISKLLIDIDGLIEICYFGTITLPDEFLITENVKITARLKAIKRLRQKLRMLIGNTYGVLKKSNKELFLGYKQDLLEIKKILPTLEDNTMRNGKIIKFGINEDRYEKVLNILEDMHDNMIEPLNQSSLIFNPKEDFDPRKIKEQMKIKLAEGGM